MSQTPPEDSPPTQESTNCRASDDDQCLYFRSVRIDDVRPTTSEERLQSEQYAQDDGVAHENEPATWRGVVAPPPHQSPRFVDHSDLPPLFQACSISHQGNMTSHCPVGPGSYDEGFFKRPVGVPPKSQAQLARRTEESGRSAKASPASTLGKQSSETASTSVRQSSEDLRKTASSPASGLTATDEAAFSRGRQHEQYKSSPGSAGVRPFSFSSVSSDESCCSASCDCFYKADSAGLFVPAFRRNEADKSSKVGSGISSQTDGEDEDDEEDDDDENECECDGEDDEYADDEADESDVEKDEEDSSDEEELGFFRDPPIYPCASTPAEEKSHSPTQASGSQEATTSWDSPWQRASKNTPDLEKNQEKSPALIEVLMTEEHVFSAPNECEMSEDIEVSPEVRADKRVQIAMDEIASSVSYNNAHNAADCSCKRQKKSKGSPRKRRKRRKSPGQPKHHIKFMLPESEHSSDEDEEDTTMEIVRYSPRFVKKPCYRLGTRDSRNTSHRDTCLCDTYGEGDRHQPKLRRTRTLRRSDGRGKGRKKRKGRGKGKVSTRSHPVPSPQVTSRKNEQDDAMCPCLEEWSAVREAVAHMPKRKRRKQRSRSHSECPICDHSVKVVVIREKKKSKVSHRKRPKSVPRTRTVRRTASGGEASMASSPRPGVAVSGQRAGQARRRRLGRDRAQGPRATASDQAVVPDHHVTLDRLEEICLEHGLHQFFDLRTFIRRIWSCRSHAYQDMQVSSQTVDLLNGCLALVFQMVATKAGIIARRFKQTTLDWVFVQDAIDELLPHSSQHAAVMQFEGRRFVNQHRMRVARQRQRKKLP